jgi:hypothetical protein
MKKIYKINLDYKIWNRVTKCIVWCSLAVVPWGDADDHSTGFVQAKSSLVKFLIFLVKLKYIVSIENNKQNKHLQCFIFIIIIIIIIISLLGILYYI